MSEGNSSLQPCSQDRILNKSGFALLLDSVQPPGCSSLLIHMRQSFRCQGSCTRAHPPQNSIVHAFMVKVHTNSRVQEALLLILALPGPFSPTNNRGSAFWISNFPCLQQEQGSWFDDFDAWGAEVRQGTKGGKGQGLHAGIARGTLTPNNACSIETFRVSACFHAGDCKQPLGGASKQA